VNALVKTIPLVLLATASAASAQTKDPVDDVDTRSGTISHMLVATFPSIQRPNGMLRIVPPNERFTTDRINGFSLSVPSHRQGAVFRLMPASGDAAALRPDWSSRYDHSTALPYRYSVFLDDHDATVAFAPGRRAAICAVDFERAPAGNHERFVLLRPQRKGSLRIEGRVITGSGVQSNGAIHRIVSPASSRLASGTPRPVAMTTRSSRDAGLSRSRRGCKGREPGLGLRGELALIAVVRDDGLVGFARVACAEALVARADAELCPRLPRGELDGTGGVVLLSPIRVLL